MTNRLSSVDYTGISFGIRVPRHDSNLHGRHEAAWFIEHGYRVTDDLGRNLRITTLADGTHRVVLGEDAFATHNERVAATAEKGRVGRDPGGRPLGLPGRELTDYEAGRWHSQDCGAVNCDHPVHFGGHAYGKLVFEPVKVDPYSKKYDNKKKKEDGESGAGDLVVPATGSKGDYRCDNEGPRW